MTEDATYNQVREQVHAHERISSTWSKDRVMADINGTALGSVTSYATGDAGMAPMEINQVKGKSKGKGQKGKGTQKGKGKDKGKSKDSGKGKGKSPPEWQRLWISLQRRWENTVKDRSC